MHILDGLNLNIKNMNACIIGRGKLVGFPLSLMLLQKQA
jgi:5,10-methylene-tetrahydrofolate dehydrogenase/methenyl tetrahydrofolate cyclohydrolase